MKSGTVTPNIQLIRLPQPVLHAIQGMIHLTRQPAGRACLAISVAKARRLPAGALAKTFQHLAHKGLLTSQRGPGGGYRLAKAPSEITAAEIISAVADGPGVPMCLMEHRPCGQRTPCAMHSSAVKADRIMRRRFESMTLADLVAAER